MTASLIGNGDKAPTPDPTVRGYYVAYREGQVNHCPGCGRSHWHIGRISAECGFCATALPLTGGMAVGAGVSRSRAPAQLGYSEAA